MARFVFWLFFKRREWWAHVTVIPLDSSTMVLSRGTWKGFNLKIPLGGQVSPSSILGAKEEWKNLQKNLKKKNTSEVIKRIIPHRNPEIT